MMTSDNQQNTVDTQTAAGEPATDASTWFAPFDSATFLSLQAAIGNRALGQLLQPEAMRQAHKNNGDDHSQTLEPEAPVTSLIVDDEAAELQAGQMRKTDFLNRLKTSVCGAAEEAFQNTIWSAMDCPYIERWFGHYENQSGQHVERALRIFVPQTARVADAGDYIPIVTERVRRALTQWAESGEMPAVPEEFTRRETPQVTLNSLVSGALSAIGRVIGIAASAVAGRALRRQ